MNILQIHNLYQISGGEDVVARDVVRLLGERHNVREIRFQSPSNEEVSGLWSKLKLALGMLYRPSSVRRLEREIVKNRPDVAIVHNVFPVASVGVINALHRQGVPVVYFLHNYRPYSTAGYLWADSRVAEEGLQGNCLPEIMAGAWRGSRALTAWYAMVLAWMKVSGAWGNVTRYVAVSEFMKSAFVRAGVAQEKIEVVRNARDVVAPEHGDRAEPIEFLFIGSLSEEKGVKILMAAWREYQARGGCGVLRMGGDGPLRAEVEVFCAGHERAMYLGYLAGEEKQEVFARSSVVVVPSVWWEPLGLVVYEAYDHQCAVVAARSGGLQETVIDGGTGWTYPAHDASALAEKMLEAEANPSEVRARGVAGRKWLEEQGGMCKWASSLERVLTQVVRD